MNIVSYEKKKEDELNIIFKLQDQVEGEVLMLWFIFVSTFHFNPICILRDLLNYNIRKIDIAAYFN